MPKEEQKPKTKEDAAKNAAPTSKPAQKKAAEPKKVKAKDAQKKKQTKVDAKKNAKKDNKKAAKTEKRQAKKEKKVEKKDVKTEAAPEKPAPKKKPTLPAVIGRGVPRKQNPKQQKTGRKAPAALPKIMKGEEGPVKEKKEKKPRVRNIHIVARPKSFHIGGDLPPKRDVSRMVKWPKYIRLQRKKKIMYNRLKVPAMINQFTQTLDKHAAKVVLRFLGRYRPESEKKRKARLLALAKIKKEGKKITLRKPFILKHGASQVTHLVEQKKAKLVVIANDVDPIEHVLFLPTLCRKMHVPYCIVKSKARLGRLVRMKTCAAIALTTIRPQDKVAFGAIQSMARNSYNKQGDHIVRNIGGGKLGLRSSIALQKRAEALKKASLDKQNE